MHASDLRADPPDPDRCDHIVEFGHATWADYRHLLRVRGERGVPRITYLDGRMELLRPSRLHLEIASNTGRLVETYCLENDVEFSALGRWTIHHKAKEAGAEPDECYVFGEEQQRKRPDLAIEVEWTSGRIDKLEVYRKLGVREVWYWREGKLQLYVLHGERYGPAAASKVLPGIDLEELARFLDRPTASQAIRAYRAALHRKGRKARSGLAHSPISLSPRVRKSDMGIMF
jgi:Uma2 family endonuclease